MTSKISENKELVVSKLKQDVCTVTFEKKDGTTRKMKCTLNANLIPTTLEIDEGRVKQTRAKNPDVLPVYDIEAAGWRSFRWDSVIEFEDRK